MIPDDVFPGSPSRAGVIGVTRRVLGWSEAHTLPAPIRPVNADISGTLKAVSPKHKCIAGGGSPNKAHLCRESEWESDRQDSVVIRGVKVRCRDLVSASEC